MPDTVPLTDDELRVLRKIIEDESHATWLRKQIKVFVPLIFTIVAGAYAFFQWLIPHWKSSP